MITNMHSVNYVMEYAMNSLTNCAIDYDTCQLVHALFLKITDQNDHIKKPME